MVKSGAEYTRLQIMNSKYFFKEKNMEKIYVYHEYNDNTPTGMITKVSFDKQELLDYLKDRADLFTRNSLKFGCSLE